MLLCIIFHLLLLLFKCINAYLFYGGLVPTLDGLLPLIHKEHKDPYRPVMTYPTYSNYDLSIKFLINIFGKCENFL